MSDPTYRIVRGVIRRVGKAAILVTLPPALPFLVLGFAAYVVTHSMPRQRHPVPSPTFPEYS